jgi:Putative peptidoglycan binding domain
MLGRFRGHSNAALAALLAGLISLASPAVGATGAHSGGASGQPSSGGGGLTGPAPNAGAPSPTRPSAKRSPFAYRGMWIWYILDSNGGDLASIVATARAHGIGTLYIKSGDGTGTWSQFTKQLVSGLHASGLHVCAWQYVYGNHPVLEAGVGAAAVRAGADCLAIDAESEYEGKYVQAQQYMTALRGLIGARFPVALAGFPYVDYHPAFPYSVFLGPGGAQYNAPQMYWAAIGTTVDAVYAHTYAYNMLYGRSIYPLGQVSGDPAAAQIVRFRQVSRVYGAGGVSWWDWQDATPSAWRAVATAAGPLFVNAASPTMSAIRQGDAGDVVVWAQEHLMAAGDTGPVTGVFGAATQAAVGAFQRAHGLPADGVIGPRTWQALLRYAPARVTWTNGGAHAARTSGGSRTMPVPTSALLRARRDEIPGSLGAGRPGP